ncbi:hypothetical protein ZWY2020_012451 [Hordeum vulgare]|nr:hypothetical protein ZWY2020_012451 [Hordeum vulgare]
MKTVAPAETTPNTPSQENNASNPKTSIVAPTKATLSQESSSSSRYVGTFLVRPTVTSRRFELDDLLRAQAKILGISRGTDGTTYKATLDSGYELVVKRLKGVHLPKAEFEQHITLIGSIQNRHIVPLQWYYCKEDEILLVYDIIPMGSLAKALHGKGSGPAPLDWEQRLAISLAAARGVQAIHLVGPSSCHGNIKSSNILLTGTHDACVSEHGLITLLDMYSKASGYRAPELTSNKQVSQKADVYSFGILLLELLTCKAPENSDMEGVHLAHEYPNKRPTMPKVVQQIEEIERESKLAPAKTPSLESSSSCQNVRTVAPAEKTPSQESSGSSPKTGTVAAFKVALSQVSRDITQNVGTFIIGSTMTDQLFDLKDLLGASTEVLGKGTVGTTYRATLDSGYELVVKRLKDVDLGEAVFKRLVTLFGAIQNKHVAPLLTYYYSKDEKFLVYNAIPMGSLAKVLHGDQGSGPAPLDWEQRSAISLGAARGLAAIHLAGLSSCHGNIKSSNILLTGTDDACVSEHGLITLGVYYNASVITRPEVTHNRWVSQKADVYSFGILMLELLSRKAPAKSIQNKQGMDLARWVCSITPEEWTEKVFDVELLGQEKKGGEVNCMFRFLQLALNCCSQYAGWRPAMSYVVEQIEEIRQS